jgi:hypothetical protein
MVEVMRLRTRLTTLLAVVSILVVGGVVAPATAAGATISGTITAEDTGMPIASGVRAELDTFNGTSWVDAQPGKVVGSDGLYSFTDLAPGQYRLEFWETSRSYGDVFYSDSGYTFDAAQARTFTVSGSESISANIALPPIGSIEAYWVDPTREQGLPVPGSVQMKVWRFDESTETWVPFVSGSGYGDANFTHMDNVPTGLYRVGYIDRRASADRYVDQWFAGQPTLDTSETIELSDFEDVELDPVTLVAPGFADVTIAQPFGKEMTWLLLQGISKGNFSGGVRTYDPTANVSRQAMAAFLYRAAGSPPFTPPAVPSFVDVPTNHGFFKEIEWTHAAGIANGFQGGFFAPGADVTREAMAAFLYRASGNPSFTPPGTASFSDYPAGSLFFKEVEWLKSVGVTTGNADGTYAPSGSVSRQAMAAFLYRKAHIATAE